MIDFNLFEFYVDPFPKFWDLDLYFFRFNSRVLLGFSYCLYSDPPFKALTIHFLFRRFEF